MGGGGCPLASASVAYHAALAWRPSACTAGNGCLNGEAIAYLQRLAMAGSHGGWPYLAA